LSATTVVGPVEVGTVDGASDFVHGSAREPGFKDAKVLDSLIGPDGLGLLNDMIRLSRTLASLNPGSLADPWTKSLAPSTVPTSTGPTTVVALN
jgi:hypothetical protein